jgi:predicted kinase
MKNKENIRELIVMIGMTASGKTYHIDKFYLNSYQIISRNHIKEAIKTTKITSNQKQLVYLVMDIIARSHLIKGLPVVIDEQNLTVESIFFWKKLVEEFGYEIKGVVLDTPLEVCISRVKEMVNGDLSEEAHETLKKEFEQVEELKILLGMKHQNILDRVTYITHGG